MDRGILTTVYARLKKKVSLTEILKTYKEFYSKESFVRILTGGTYPATKAVKGSNYCDISLFLDNRNSKIRTLIIVSAIDNLLKGASGLAVQNMNIMCGFDETTGLLNIPPFP